MKIIIDDELKEEKPALSLTLSLIMHGIIFFLLFFIPTIVKVNYIPEEKPVEVVIPKKNPLKLYKKNKKRIEKKKVLPREKIKKEAPKKFQKKAIPPMRRERVYSDRMLEKEGKGAGGGKGNSDFFSGILNKKDKFNGNKLKLKKFYFPLRKKGKNFFNFKPEGKGFGSYEGHGGGAYFNTHGYNLDPWVKAVLKKVKKNWIPPLAAKAGIKGVCAFYLVFHRDGSVSDLRMIKSSGIPSYDQSSFGALRFSIPFPEFPNYYPYDTIEARFVFYYNIYPE